MPTTFANTINGDEILAKRSQCDYAGNDIQTTYATKSELPTATSQLTNDSGFITSVAFPVTDVQVDGTSVVNANGVAEVDLSNYATTQALTNGLAAKQDVISDLATIRSGAALGATAVQQADLAPYATTSAMNAALADKQDTLTAGPNVNITNNVISATDTTYTAGTGIDITSGAISVENPLPSSTSSDEGKVLKVDANGDPTWATGGGGGGGVNADWTEDDPLEPSYIENKPTPKTLTAGANISISEGVGTLTISAAAGLPASTSADEGKCLVVDSNGDPEWGTGGKTYTGTNGVVVDNVNDTVGLEAPVDIVAGPGIAIDNPDGNTVRVSANMDSTYLNQLAAALGIDRTELWSGTLSPATGSNCNQVISLSESILNFERIEVFCTGIVSYLTWSPRDRSGNAAYRGINENASNDVVIGAMMIQEDDRTKLRYRCGYGSSFTTAYRGEYGGYGTPYKVVGVHRISGGN